MQITRKSSKPFEKSKIFIKQEILSENEDEKENFVQETYQIENVYQKPSKEKTGTFLKQENLSENEDEKENVEKFYLIENVHQKPSKKKVTTFIKQEFYSENEDDEKEKCLANKKENVRQKHSKEKKQKGTKRYNQKLEMLNEALSENDHQIFHDGGNAVLPSLKNINTYPKSRNKRQALCNISNFDQVFFHDADDVDYVPPTKLLNAPKRKQPIQSLKSLNLNQVVSHKAEENIKKPTVIKFTEPLDLSKCRHKVVPTAANAPISPVPIMPKEGNTIAMKVPLLKNLNKVEPYNEKTLQLLYYQEEDSVPELGVLLSQARGLQRYHAMK